jgi:gliding motility-associated-like protein
MFVCLFDSAVFINASFPPSVGAIGSFTWDYGDGTPLNSTMANPQHLYSATGTYWVSLITRSSNLSCPDTLIDSLIVFPMPTAGFTAADVCFGQAMNFYDQSLVNSGSTVNAWNWDFGDSGLSATQNPSHTYTNYGSYNVVLIATTNNNCRDTVSSAIVVHPLPTAAFIGNNVCFGSVTSFTDQSVLPVNVTNDNIVSWIWNFGDGSLVSNNQNTTHLYSSVGSDTAQLTIFSNFGCADSINAAVIINPNPQVNFTVNDTIGCELLCITFHDSSSVYSGANAAWTWSFGDSSLSVSGSLANHCFYNDSVYSPVFYTITLSVTSDSGCMASLVKPNYIEVLPLPESSFAVVPVSATIVNPVISITNLSAGADFWNWDLGDTDTTSVENPVSHTYADTGTYQISLITVTQYGCSDTAYETVIIEPEFTIYIPNAFSPNNDEVNDTFICKSSFISEFKMAIFDRWGNLIYETDSIEKPWDGRANRGTDMAQTDVYVYSIHITDIKNKKHSIKGMVTLIK